MMHRLAEAGQTVQALIVNRVHPSFGEEAPAGRIDGRKGSEQRVDVAHGFAG